MRFSDTTRKTLVKLFMEGVSIQQLAECYTTTPEAMERQIRLQLKEDNQKKP